MISRLRGPVGVSILAAISVAVVGGAMTDIGPWYRELEKPSFNPPDWLFGPAWTIIYGLCVVAAVKGWRAARTSRERSWLVSLFFCNAVLNVFWSALFFTFRRPDLALAEALTLWLSVLALIIFFWRFSRPSSLVLLPYLAWVAFAALLNFAIVKLNAPFA